MKTAGKIAVIILGIISLLFFWLVVSAITEMVTE